MLFTSPLFLFVFLPLFLSAYFLVPKSIQKKNYVALGGSVLFFAWGEPFYVLALLVFTFIDYKVSVAITPDAKGSQSSKKFILIAAIFLNVIVLVLSKYLGFIVGNLATFIEPLRQFKESASKIPLLLGISFITFHRVSFLVDSYKGRATPPRNFVDCLLYIFLFPQLIAGPIIRYQDIGDQIQHRIVNAQGFLNGFFRFSVGLAKKVYLADTMGVVADKIFNFEPQTLPLPFAWGGIIAYTLQIYIDFSAYSDMAIGLAQMMGFRFPENFNRPYLSTSITQFWQRWHISLSTWMRIYLYVPLGGNRVSQFRTYLNLWIVFLISGFWHGASWNFIMWGAYYGFFLSAERALVNLKLKIKVPFILQHIYVLVVVMIGWVLFRSTSLTGALSYLCAMFGMQKPVVDSMPPWGVIFYNRDVFVMTVAATLALVKSPANWTSIKCLRFTTWEQIRTQASLAGLFCHFLLGILLLIAASSALVSSNFTPFLYFRF